MSNFSSVPKLSQNVEIEYGELKSRDINPDAIIKNEQLAQKLDEQPEEILHSGQIVEEAFVTDLLESPLGQAIDIESALDEINDSHDELEEHALADFDAIPHECQPGRDYTITGTENPNSDGIVLSIHGGGIEEPTSDISQDLADLFGWSRYDFAAHGTAECLLGEDDFARLHIDSEIYNEPLAVEMVETLPKSVSIHGFGTENYQNVPEGMILVGGKNIDQVETFINYIEEHQDGFEPYALYPIAAVDAGEAFAEIAGQGENNIVNRNANEAGLQLELTEGLRADLGTNELIARDEDILRLKPEAGQSLNQGNWSKYLDASDIDLGDLSSEDIKAIALDREGNILFSTLGEFSITNPDGEVITGNGSSILKLTPSVTGAYTAGVIDIPRFSETTNEGLKGQSVDAISLATAVNLDDLGSLGGLDKLDYQGDADDLFFSLSDSATLDDTIYREEDILAFDGNSFQKYFDGSDVGLKDSDIDAFDIISKNEILISLTRSIRLEVDGESSLVRDGDILKFNATRLGNSTQGSFEFYLKEREVGLRSSSEDIDALQLTDDGSLLVSTVGNAEVYNSFHSEQLKDIMYGAIQTAMGITDEQAAENLTLRPNLTESENDNLSQSDDFYFSLEETIEINGVPYDNEDILGFDGTEVKQLFDGSDLGLVGANIDAFDILNENEILLSFVTPTTININGVPTEVDDSDVLKFTAAEFGHNTIGEFDLLFDGSEYGLDTDGEDIDSIQLLNDGSLLLSLVGSSTVIEGFISRDEDVLRIQTNTANPELGAEWSMYFDGSDVDLNGNDAGDIKGITLTEEGNLNFSTAGDISLKTLSENFTISNKGSRVEFIPELLGTYTDGNFDSQQSFNVNTLTTTDVNLDGIDLESTIAFDDLPTAPRNPTELLLSMRPSTVEEELINPNNQEHLLFSVDNTINLQGVEYRDEDIIARTDSGYQLYFDGSEVGISAADIDAFDIIDDQSILLSFSTPTSILIDGVDTEVDDSDIVEFSSVDLGRATDGEFELFFDGSEFGLEEDNHDIDGLQLLEDGSLLISMLGSSTDLIDGLFVRDEDILRVDPNVDSLDDPELMSTYLDGSDLNLNVTNGGDIDALTLSPSGELQFSPVDDSLVADNAGNEILGGASDVFSFSPSTLGLVTNGLVANSLLFDSSSGEFGDVNINGISTENFINLEQLNEEIDQQNQQLLNLRPSVIAEANSAEEEHLLFSLTSTADLNGANYRDEDIIVFDGIEFKSYFDGSQVGLSPYDIDAFDIVGDQEILLSFSTTATLTIDGVSTEVDDSDLVKFVATELGSNTTGHFEMFFDGSEFGLTEPLQDIDGVQLLNDDSLLISTIGSTETIPGVRTDDEDILRLESNFDSNDHWSLYFDGGNADLANNNTEDTNAFTLDQLGQLHLSTIGDAQVLSANGTELTSNNLSILQFHPTSLGVETAGSYLDNLLFDGTAFGLSENSINALSLEFSIDL